MSSNSAVPEALSIGINQKVYDLKRKGLDVITLSLGEAFFELPLFDFTTLDTSIGFHYCDSQGLPELREKIAHFYRHQYLAKSVSADSIIVSAGSKIILFMTFTSILANGGEVLIPEPAWLSYKEQIRLAGGKEVFIPADVTIDRYYEYISDDTRAVVINNPNNPSGRPYTRNDLLQLKAICDECDLLLIVDEAYSDFIDTEAFHSAATLFPADENVLTVNSLSKNMGMSGWRIGYAIASSSRIQQLLTINQHLITCAPSILQQYLVQYFDQIIERTLPQVKQVTTKRNASKLIFEKNGMNVLEGSSTFYLMVDVSAFNGTTEEFAHKLLSEYRISVVPGIAYGESVSNYVRVSTGAESLERIEHAAKIFTDLISTSKHY